MEKTEFWEKSQGSVNMHIFFFSLKKCCIQQRDSNNSIKSYFCGKKSELFCVNKIKISIMSLGKSSLLSKYITIFFVVAGYCRIYPNKFKFPDVDVWDWYTVKAILPLSLLFTAMISTNNLCLKYASVTYYYIGRSLTTVFNVMFTYLILGEKTSGRCITCCAVIIFGFWLGIDQENLAGSLSTFGFIFGILGSLSLSLFSIFTKKVLPKVNGEVWTMSYANNVYATVLLAPMMALNGELTEIYNYSQLFDLYFWIIIAIGGVCGFAIGFFTTLQIKYTSALTHNISGTAKACAQTVLATYFYKETKSLLWWTSNIIVLVGSACYTWIKQIDMEKRHRENTLYQKV
ncbi:hypothetical protein NQ317_008426 [Molorchus minor]|uniref:Sugar phosphate transporter domain-containing protein n=1 Tax=Molorchus minor TaxID=1323400 RepID=A0ABQ9JGE6_9CUCU|nr:hypothetical protein NQ317_008426 [Molorchus minor]